MLTKTKTLIDKYTNVLVVTGLLLVVVAILTGGISLSFSKKSRTAKAAPTTVVTNSATSVTTTSATLNGNITASDSSISARGFEWGTDTSYGNTVSSNDPSTSATLQTQWGSAGSGNGQFSNPYGVSVSSGGNVYVTDRGNNSVQVFDSNGNYLNQFGSAGSGNGQFANPTNLAINSSGSIYVADNLNNRIQVFNSSGVYQSQFGTGQLYSPNGIAIKSNGSDAIQEGAIFQLFQPVLFATSPAIHIVPSIGLRDVHRPVGVDRHSVE